ncbi:vasoactive intestinal polypeptide receptor isoform X2 [Scleropages formosus]|uniref:vasoactive intestinal polypeptide receptor isoform X2 n=1 Tax=Scleropages formosus TaxID=113540 RepID=UPI000878F02B|nr:vasoactive intestinal polypeptide receptor-like isoform X2 [Scleropages formosus]
MEMDASKCLLLLLSLSCFFFSVRSKLMCDIIAEIQKDKDRCLLEMENENVTSGCQGMWDFMICWPSARLGEVVTVACPNYFSSFSFISNLSKTCTLEGWTKVQEHFGQNCGYNQNSTIGEEKGNFFTSVRTGYTIGHSVSLISLTAAIIILCIFRKLHCTRNYIHMHLFVSFILKAIAILMKDVVLYEVGEFDDCFSESDDSPTLVSNSSAVRASERVAAGVEEYTHYSRVGCKAVMVFLQYAVMASFFWLLVEGLYLHALLAVSFFSERKYFWAYILIGWGGPIVFITAWSFAKAYFNHTGCWDIIEATDRFWWIIKTPILASILVNFILFICIIRILHQKINCPDIGRNESNQYSRLAKSTLLLIPLFGINYIIFAFIPEDWNTDVRMVFDLILGSFQGFVVAVLYCFLNGEVQAEVKRKWRRWHMERFLGADMKSQQPSIGSNGNNFSTQITILTKCSPTTRRASACHDDSSVL